MTIFSTRTDHATRVLAATRSTSRARRRTVPPARATSEPSNAQSSTTWSSGVTSTSMLFLYLYVTLLLSIHAVVLQTSRINYSWVPYTKAPNPCELNCMPHAERFYFRHKKSVIDGTRCNDDSFDVCVAGVCQVTLTPQHSTAPLPTPRVGRL